MPRRRYGAYWCIAVTRAGQWSHYLNPVATRKGASLRMTLDNNSGADRPTRRDWRDIARELAQEENPNRLLQLTKELDEAMLAEERQKVMRRLRERSLRET
jgi:hypothetical protein